MYKYKTRLYRCKNKGGKNGEMRRRSAVVALKREINRWIGRSTKQDSRSSYRTLSFAYIC